LPRQRMSFATDERNFFDDSYSMSAVVAQFESQARWQSLRR
jgi:hypothetical protein